MRRIAPLLVAVSFLFFAAACSTQTPTAPTPTPPPTLNVNLNVLGVQPYQSQSLKMGETISIKATCTVSPQENNLWYGYVLYRDDGALFINNINNVPQSPGSFSCNKDFELVIDGTNYPGVPGAYSFAAGHRVCINLVVGDEHMLGPHATLDASHVRQGGTVQLGTCYENWWHY